MKAKDTVMKKKKISKVISESEEDNDEFWMPADATKLVAQAQAEISFPLGKQEGRREVVEYLDKHKGAMVRLVSNGGETIKTTFEINSSEWQAQLKEWGLKEDSTSD